MIYFKKKDFPPREYKIRVQWVLTQCGFAQCGIWTSAVFLAGQKNLHSVEYLHSADFNTLQIRTVQVHSVEYLHSADFNTVQICTMQV